MSGGQRYDALMVREYVDRQGETRSQWTKIGSAFANLNGSIAIMLDALPAPQLRDGVLETRIILQVPKPKEEWGNRQGGGGGGYARGGSQSGGGQRRGGPPRRVQPQLPQRPQAPEPPPEYPSQEPENGFPDDDEIPF